MDNADHAAPEAQRMPVGASPPNRKAIPNSESAGSPITAGQYVVVTQAKEARKSPAIVSSEAILSTPGSSTTKRRRQIKTEIQKKRAAASPGKSSNGGHSPNEPHGTIAPNGRATNRLKSTPETPAQSISNGHIQCEDHCRAAVAGDSQNAIDIHAAAAVPTIIELWKRRQSWHRAEKSLTLQCSAFCRRFVGGDKKEAGLLLARVEKDDPSVDAAIAISCMPLLAAREMLAVNRKAVEKEISRLVSTFPVAQWATNIRGIAAPSLGALIGECGDIGSYKSVSAVWKRMGLAVIDGGRQRRVAGTDALLHGYSPARRCVAWNVGVSLMRSQKAGDYYRDFYDAEKAKQLARGLSKGHAHNRACRHMTKQFLAHLYGAWCQEQDGPLTRRDPIKSRRPRNLRKA